jgi:predicted RNase H-like HicB family nuclease
MTLLTYTVEIDLAETGNFVASVPALPGCGAVGKSLEEAVCNIQEAIEAFIADLAKRGESIPTENKPKPALTLSIQVLAPIVSK